MPTIKIHDLAKSEELDRKAMATIQGGMCGGCGMPYNGNNAAFVSGFGGVLPPSRYDATLPY